MNIRKPVVTSTAQKGYISIIILTIIAAVMYAVLPQKFQFSGISCPEMPSAEEQEQSEIKLPGIRMERNYDGTPTSEERTYRLVRKNIKLRKIVETAGEVTNYIDSHTVPFRNITAKNGKTYEVRYPRSQGEFDVPKSLEPIRNITRPDITNMIIMRDFNMVYFLHLGEDGKRIEGFGKDKDGNSTEYILTDFYQDTSIELLHKDVLCSVVSAAVETPMQKFSKNRRELQLEYFLFGKFEFANHCKPAIYLYPKEKTEVSVAVFPKGYFTYTDPKYPEGGWKAIADPSGSLIVDGKQYDYLYYEARIHDSEIEKPKDGFVIAYGELSTFYDTILPKLGLNAKETADFREYWLKTLPKSPYYFVGIISQNNLDYIEPLKISPKPDSILRVSLYFEALENKKAIMPPIFSSFQRNGFAVVEWGGMVKADKDHPFTCSQ